MRDVDERVLIIRLEQEAALTESIKDRLDLRWRRFRDRRQFAQSCRTAGSFIFGPGFYQSLEHPACDHLALRVTLKFPEYLLRVAVEGSVRTSNCIIVGKIQRGAMRTSFMRGLPCTQQSVLQNRQSIGAVAHVIEQPLHKLWRDLGSSQGDGAFDGLALLVA